jgi:hypothetical protein
MSKRQSKLNTNEAAAVRCTFTLPANLYKDLSSVSMAMGVSRSGLLVNVIGDSIHDMAVDLHDLYSSQPGPNVIRRLRGNSIAKVEEAYRDFLIETCQDDPTGEVVRS